MERDYVFGYGAIIETSKFVKLFPDLFKYDSEREKWSPVLYANTYTQFHVHYSLHKNTNIIFPKENPGAPKEQLISVTSSEGVGFDYKNMNDPYHHVDMTQINQQKDSLDKWIQTYFPEVKLGYFIYLIQ